MLIYFCYSRSNENKKEQVFLLLAPKESEKPMNALTSQKDYTRFNVIQLFLALIPIVSFLLQQTHLSIATAIAFCLLILKALVENIRVKNVHPQKHHCTLCHKLAVLQHFTIYQKRIAICAECYLHSPAYKRKG